MHTEEDVIDTYLRHYELRREEDFWAFDEVKQLFLQDDRETAWRVTHSLVAKASHEALGYVAAGPLEDFLYSFGLDGMDEVENVARNDERLREALSMVYVERDDPIWERWFALMNEFGFAEKIQTDL